MGFRNLIVTQHAHLTYRENNMIIQTADGIKVIPVSDLNVVLLDSLQIVIDTYLINELNRRAVALIFVDDKHQPSCVLTSQNFNDHYNAKLQQQIKWQLKTKQIVWSKIVANKISMQNQVLNWSGYDNELQPMLNDLKFNDHTNREAVAARKYFPLLFVNANFNRRDDDLGVNAVLNYGYAILLAMVDREIVSHGYVTELGIHHCNDQNLYNLGSDLMEPFRPVIDYWVANHNISELNPDIKYSLIGLMNVVIQYNDRKMKLYNAIATLVNDCLAYLSLEKTDLKMKVELSDEVSNYAIVRHV